MNKILKCEFTGELLQEIGYRFPDTSTRDAFLTYVNGEYRSAVARTLINSMTEDQISRLRLGCISQDELMSRLLSMIDSGEELPQVETVVMGCWLSLLRDLKAWRSTVMAGFDLPAEDG